MESNGVFITVVVSFVWLSKLISSPIWLILSHDVKNSKTTKRTQIHFFIAWGYSFPNDLSDRSSKHPYWLYQKIQVMSSSSFLLSSLLGSFHIFIPDFFAICSKQGWQVWHLPLPFILSFPRTCRKRPRSELPLRRSLPFRSGVRVSRIAFEVGGSASRTTSAKLAIIQYSVSRMLGKNQTGGSIMLNLFEASITSAAALQSILPANL